MAKVLKSRMIQSVQDLLDLVGKSNRDPSTIYLETEGGGDFEATLIEVTLSDGSTVHNLILKSD